MKKRIGSLCIVITLLFSFLPQVALCADASYSDYISVVEECMQNCGYANLSTTDRNRCRGLLYDLNDDGQSELILQYVEGYSWAYEVWTLKNGGAVCLLDTDVFSTTGAATISVTNHDGEKYIVFNSMSAGSSGGGTQWTLYLISDGPYQMAYDLVIQEYWDEGSAENEYYVNEKYVSKGDFDEIYANLENEVMIPMDTDGMPLDELLEVLKSETQVGRTTHSDAGTKTEKRLVQIKSYWDDEVSHTYLHYNDQTGSLERVSFSDYSYERADYVYEYDAQNRLVKVETGNRDEDFYSYYCVKFTYDEKSRVSSVETHWPMGDSQLRCIYDNQGKMIRIVGEKDSSSDITEFFYNESGVVTQAIRNNNFEETFNYQHSEDGRVINATVISRYYDNSEDINEYSYQYDYYPFVIQGAENYCMGYYDLECLDVLGVYGMFLYGQYLPLSTFVSAPLSFSCSKVNNFIMDADGYLEGIEGTENNGHTEVKYEFIYEEIEVKANDSIESENRSIDDSFSIVNAGWSFANVAQSFAEEPVSHADDYFIPRERYDALFGRSYVDATEGLYTEEWSGNCAGMSATAILFFLDSLNWEGIDTEYTEDFANPNDFYRTVNLYQKHQDYSYYPAIGNDTEVTRLIEAYQLYINAIDRSRLVENLENTYFAAEPEIGTLYGVTAENEPITTVNHIYKHIPASEGGTYITSMLAEFHKAYDENNPLLIVLQGDGFGHGIVSRTDRKPEDMGDGWSRVYVYDPNKPYINESVCSIVSGVEAEPKYTFGCNALVDKRGDIYLELNPSLNQWRYCTSVNSDSADSYIGSTLSGELLWNGVYGEDENNEQYHVMRPDYFYTIDLTDLTMDDFENPHFDSTSAWIPENDLAIAVDGNTDCSIYASTGELVAIVEDGDAFVLSDAGSYDAYIGQTEDGGSFGGKLYLPTDTYTVYYSSGAVQFLGSSNVISFTCEDAAELTVDIALNSLQIIAQEDGIAAVKCANVISADECSYVETEGTLLAGETFSIAYSDENKVKASTDSKDGEFQLYQKDADQEEASATKVIKSNSLWWLWITGSVVLAAAVVLTIMIKRKKNI